MKKFLRALFVLAIFGALVGAASADAGGGCYGPYCYAGAYADADVDVSISFSHTGPDLMPKAGVDLTTVTVTAEGNSVALANAIAYIRHGMAFAATKAGADLWADAAVFGPDGSLIAYDSSYESVHDGDWDFDCGKHALAVANSYVDGLSITFTFTFLPTEGTYDVYGYGDSIAYADAYSSASFFLWLKTYCEEHDWDFAWDEAWFQFYAKLWQHPSRRVNFALGPNDGVIQPSPLPVWGSCAGECSNYDGHFPFVYMITGVDYDIKYWYRGVAPYTAGVFRTLKKGANVPLTLWLRENPADGKMYYCNVSLEDGRDYVMSGGMDCD